MGKPGATQANPVGLSEKFSLGDYQLKLDPKLKEFNQASVSRGPVGVDREDQPATMSLSMLGQAKQLLDAVRATQKPLFMALRDLPLALSPPSIIRQNCVGNAHSRLVFGPIDPGKVLNLCKAYKLDALATEINKQTLLDAVSPYSKTFWLVYENDGPPPLNPGAGSDQGKTAKLSAFVTFDDNHTGLTRLGATIIDMRTPRGYLDGQDFDPSSTYRTSGGPYSGITSIDFGVTVKRNGLIKVEIFGSVGADSTTWGKFVQDVIHKKLSKSPLFPWKAGQLRPFVELGAAALVTPDWVLSQNNVLGIDYTGKIEFDAEIVTGTHRTETSAGARIVLRTTTVNTAFGKLRAEYQPIGVFGRAFVRYGDGREAGFAGVEGGANSKLMVWIGRFGIGIEGQVLSSTDPASQTDNRVGGGPVLNPLSGTTQSGDKLGAPAGHHGSGTIFATWRF